MVFLTNQLAKDIFKKTRAHFRRKWLDSLRLTVSGGHGGAGLPKLGGVGGQGGCVYFVANPDVTLNDVVRKNQTKRVSAGPGDDSHKYRILGKRGTDVMVEVPVGITIIREDGKVISELNQPESNYLAAGGGSGGCAGNSFIGQRGQSRTLTLDLKLIADVGLVGFPNAGKSTLLKAVSNASPKIASYPFTTIQPQLGIIEYPDQRQISIADLPGLIEGAHANFGLGHKFLKHVERTRMLLVMVDIFGFQLSPKHKKRNYLETIYALNRELELYDRSILDMPAILLLNKTDKEDASKELNRFEKILPRLEDGLELCPPELRPEQLLKFEHIIPVSAKESNKIDKVKEVIRDVLDRDAEAQLGSVDDEESTDSFKRKHLVQENSSILV